jgi:CheY-like chemotaxis protein
MAAEPVKATRVLYVEDDKDLQFPMMQILGILGYQVECADNGKIGLEKAETWKPDIILMDVRMPVMDGPTAIRILRSKPETEHTPIIVLSAYSDSKTREACKQAGANAFFTKPIDFEKIDAIIKAHLGLAKN